MPNLVLIGFMGTGKTSVGRKVARKLGMKFVDTDLEVERITGMTISELFKKCGEIRFRSEEKAAVRRLSRESNQVISTGGGVVIDQENIQTLRDNGILICLTADPEVIFERVKNKKTRPLLRTKDPLESIRSLLKERQPYYECTDHTIDTSNLSLDEVVEEVLRVYTELRSKRE